MLFYALISGSREYTLGLHGQVWWCTPLFNSSIQKTGARWYLQDGGQPGLHSDFQTRAKSLNLHSHTTEEKIGNASKLACEQVHTFHISQVISHNQTQFTYKIDTRPLPVLPVT